MIEDQAIEKPDWPLRVAILVALGGALGLTIHFLTRGPEVFQWTENPARLGLASALAAAGIVFAFSLERLRWTWSAAFAAVVGLIVGFVTYWNGQPNSWGAGEGWQLFSALFAIAIAVPIFQASRDCGRWSTDYRSVHGHAWTNIVLWFAAWGFTGLVFLLFVLLSELFQLIDINVLRDLLDKPWFGLVLGGSALGGAVGLLRDRDKILGMLQRVVTAILSVLAPALAIGLVLFVASLPFTGLKPLWEQTASTTPLLLVCVLGAVILANTAIGNGPEEETRSRIVRLSAAALAGVTLPLALVAVISTGKRIGQHGLTPDRLWAAVFVGIALAASLAYLYALVRGRSGWPERVRSANIGLALGICALALFLALPILSFGALSTRDQVARLEAGRIAPDKFDWAALRYDFGPSGRRAIEQLTKSRVFAVRDNARAALAAKSRWDARQEFEDFVQAPREMRVFPTGTAVPQDLRDAVLGRPGKPGACIGKGECLLFWKPPSPTAIALMDGCAESVVGRAGQTMPKTDCTILPHVLERSEKGWSDVRDSINGFPEKKVSDEVEAAMLWREREAIRRGDVEVREITRRQLFIGGEARGVIFD